MNYDQREMIVRRQSEEANSEHRAVLQIEWTTAFLLHALVKFFLFGTGQVFKFHFEPVGRIDHEHRLASLMRKTRAQRLVPSYKLLDGPFKRFGSELAAEAAGRGHIIFGPSWL